MNYSFGRSRDVGENVEIMVDAGGSEQFWPHGVNWARNTANMLADYDIVWLKSRFLPTTLKVTSN